MLRIIFRGTAGCRLTTKLVSHVSWFCGQVELRQCVARVLAVWFCQGKFLDLTGKGNPISQRGVHLLLWCIRKSVERLCAGSRERQALRSQFHSMCACCVRAVIGVHSAPSVVGVA